MSLAKTLAGLGQATQAVTETVEKATKPQYPAGAGPSQVFGAPHVRHGEDRLSSRPFMLLKLFGVMAGKLKPQDAKLELDALSEFA